VQGRRGRRAASPSLDLRQTYATIALRAGASVCAVSRFIGSSIAMIDHHYGHLGRDSRELAVSFRCARDRQSGGRWVDRNGEPQDLSATAIPALVEAITASRGRSVDAEARSVAGSANRRS
jgi:hypothetical protein